MNIRFNNDPLATALIRLWAEAWVLGDDAAGEALFKGRQAMKAVEGTVDWAKWKAGDKVAALMLRKPKAFQKILDDTGISLKNMDKTSMDRIGTALADSIELGLSPTSAAKLINNAVGNPARALTIAITETSRVLNSAAITRYRDAGVESMKWMTVLAVAGGSVACEVCAPNNGVVVKVGDSFPSGNMQPPAHPHCRCALLPDFSEYFEPTQHGVVDIAPKTEPEFARVTDEGRKAYKRLLRNTDYDADAKYAAQRWQGEDYRRIQSGLSSGKVSELSDEVREIVDILDDNMVPFTDDIDYLYRGMTDGLDTLKVGDTFKSPLYQAATTDPVTAAGFSKSSGSVMGGVAEGETVTILRIDAYAGKGMVVPDSDEFEVILARGTRFEVTDISEETINGVKMRIIDVEAVKK
jgi:SPP1 gp7 family putative phage head morphogenesis protein